MTRAVREKLHACSLPTPLEKLSNISKMYSCELYVKRDDLTGQSFGGNKERKLEFIMADALRTRATVIVTVGTLQSNHCRMTTALANKLGLKTELILIADPAEERTGQDGNHMLFRLMHAGIHMVHVSRVKDKIVEVLDNLRNRGETPYFIEGGGHSVSGTLGYIFAVEEVKKQTEAMQISPDYVVVPTGTGTTQAGLILGTRLFEYDIEIIGISVSRDRAQCCSAIADIAKRTDEYLGIDSVDYRRHIKVSDAYIGGGYGIATAEGMNALKLMAENEGLIVDPVYNAKAVAGMFDLISTGRLKGVAIYLNTGGLPALFTKDFCNRRV